MRLNTKATNITLTPDIQEYLEKRVEAIGKIIDLNNSTLLIETELARTTEHHQSGDIFMAEINLTYEGEHFRAVSETCDIVSDPGIIKINMNTEWPAKKEILIVAGIIIAAVVFFAVFNNGEEEIEAQATNQSFIGLLGIL